MLGQEVVWKADPKLVRSCHFPICGPLCGDLDPRVREGISVVGSGHRPEEAEPGRRQSWVASRVLRAAMLVIVVS